MLIDACSAINLFNCGLLEAACAVERLLVSPAVLSECGPQCAGALMALAEAGFLDFVDDHQIDTDRFLTLIGEHDIGDGELEAITVCELTGQSLCTDDRKARTLAQQLLGIDNVCGSLGLLRRAVDSQVIPCDTAFGGYKKMIQDGAWLPQLEQEFFCNTEDC